MNGKIVIEHLEESYSLWLIYEYINSALSIKGNVIYTNVKSERVSRILKRYGRVYSKRVDEIFNEKELIVLDPKAGETLEPGEAKNKIIVVGGILGDYPPRGRTEELLSRRLENASKRNIGDKQLSIDGAVYTAYMILSGYRLDEIEYVDSPVIKGDDFEVTLPYRYPIKDGKPLISPVVEAIVKYLGVFDEYWLRTL